MTKIVKEGAYGGSYLLSSSKTGRTFVIEFFKLQKMRNASAKNQAVTFY